MERVNRIGLAVCCREVSPAEAEAVKQVSQGHSQPKVASRIQTRTVHDPV